MKLTIWAIVPVLALAGCGQGSGDRAGGVDEVTIIAKGDARGKIRIAANDEGSRISINGDGVKINADLPGIAGLDVSSNFDIDGVKLYPGAKISSVNINADSGQTEGRQGRVELGLTAPAAPDVVLAWYAKAFGAKGITTTTKGGTLSGKTSDGEKFAIELAPDGKGAKGVVRVTG